MMNGEWTRALVLILLFAAIVLLVERLVGRLLIDTLVARGVGLVKITAGGLWLTFAPVVNCHG